MESCLILPFDKEFGFMANKFFTLLVFFNPMKKNLTDNEKMEWNREIIERISDNLDTAYLPNQIDYFPLIPKISPKGIDRIWCATQYQKGLLAKKAQTPVYQL
ncbi:MAG: hypothetical protein LLG04_16525, partial [Parachlamydia sp.]|nr:hypothetical protein [Parachlamydia sp.]